MALTDKEIGSLVARAYPDLRAGARNALLQLFLAMRDDYVAVVAEAIAALLEGGVYLTDADGNALATQQSANGYVPMVKAQAIEDRLDETNMLLRELIESLKGQ